VISLVLATLVLAACPAAPAAPVAPATPAPTQPPALTATAAPAPELAATAAPTAEPPPSAEPEPAALTPATATAEPAEDAAAQIRTFVIVPGQTTAQYSVDETFINDNNRFATAIGKTSVVEGSLALNYADPVKSELGEITVDISTLASDSGRRDNAIRERWLESARFPLASFQAKEIRGFPADPQEGQPIEFQLAGDMKIKDTMREQVWDVTATLDGDTLTGTATTFLMLADYNVPVPEILGIVSVTDGLTATLDFTMASQ
jgi:polyisoprenoid-binding protein YceI